MNSVKLVRRENRLWLLVLPPLLSFALVCLLKPTGRFAFCIELSIFCLCSLVCGFALSIKSFKTLEQRFWGGIFFAGSSFYLIGCVVFIGCLPIPPGAHESPQQMAEQRQRNEEQFKENAAKRIPPRDAAADSSMLDLSPFYDSILPGAGLSNNGHFHALQPGTHIFDGTKFDARGIVRLAQARQVNGIPVGQKCSEIDFLYGAYYGRISNVAAIVVIHFENNDTETVPIIFGQGVWTRQALSDLNTNAPVGNSIVWNEWDPTNGPPQSMTKLLVKKWPNPSPEEIVRSIDFNLSYETPAAFLVAVTIKPITQK